MLAVTLLFTGSTPFQLRGETDIIVPVTIDGHGPFRFLLDTGSSRSAVTRALARRFNRVPTGYTTVVTPAGQSRRALVPIEGVTIGSEPASSVIAMIAGADDLDAGLDGLIGQDILRTRSYTIDYRHRRVVWHAAGQPAPAAVRLPLEWRQHRFVVSMPQQTAGAVLRLVPDSGADGWVFFARRGRTLPPLTPLDTVGMRTLSGPRLLRRVLFERLDVGRVALLNQSASLIETPDGQAPFEDGLLPLHLFARVTFDARDGVLAVEPR